MPDLEQFLARYSGRVESEGSFTVSVDKARHKLEKFRLARPTDFVLELFATAYLGGATRFQVGINERSLFFVFDGKPFTAEELDDLDRHSYLGTGSRRLQRFSVGIAGIKSTDFEEFLLTTTGSDRVLVWSLKQGEAKGRVTLQESTNLERPANVLKLRMPDKSRHAWALGAGHLAEYLKRCLHTPVEVALNGKILPPPAANSHGYWRFRHPELADTLPIRGKANPTPKEVSALFQAELSVLSPKENLARLECLVDGVAYRVDQGLLGNRVFTAVVTSPKFRLDLSHSGIAKGGDFLNLISELQREAHRAFWQTTTSLKIETIPDFWPEAVGDTRSYFADRKSWYLLEAIDQWLESWEAVARERRRQKEIALAKKALKQTEQRFRLALLAPNKQSLKLADELESQGRFEDAAQLRRSLALRLAEDILNAVDSSALRAAAREVWSFLAQHRIPLGLQPLLEKVVDFQPRPQGLEEAVCGGDYQHALKLALEQGNSLMVAGCLELLGSKKGWRDSLLIRERLAAETDDPCLKALMLEYMARKWQGRAGILRWTKLRTQASWAQHSARQTLHWRLLPKPLQSLFLNGSAGEHTIKALNRIRFHSEISPELFTFCEDSLALEFLHQEKIGQARAVWGERYFREQSLPILDRLRMALKVSRES